MIKRDKTDKKVIDWEDEKSGFSTTIYLNGTKFVATLLEREFEAPDVGLLKRLLKDYAHHWLEMEWFPVVQLVVKEPTDNYGSRRHRDDADCGHIGTAETTEFKRP